MGEGDTAWRSKKLEQGPGEGRGISRNLDHLRACELWGRLPVFALQEILLRAFQQQSDTT